MIQDENIQQAEQYIKDADAILITAGAGMGVDSGLPDFRGTKGFWKAYPPIEKLGLSFSDMANPLWFEEKPSLAWAFYGHRLNLYRDTVPHDGFKMLLDLVKEKNDNYFIYTSNVDGQFQKAGFDNDKIYEVHGSIHHLQCSKSCLLNLSNNISPSRPLNKFQIWEADSEYIDVDMDKFEAKNIPLCENCGEVARPNILMFGDWNWNSQRASKQEAKYNTWRKRNKTKKIAIIEIGAGTSIPTIRIEGQQLSSIYKNTKLIRINPREYEMKKNIGFSIPFGGLEGLKKVLQWQK
ncbi:MAG: Sir2 family NAD-dependent protein deacetylase [Campylobacterota bacterium]|nr:Sir2 family NAD-dependent protein deacetylase [Campylobacterota bacterium]